MTNRKKLLFFYVHLYVFTEKDLDFLYPHFRVEKMGFAPRLKIMTPLVFFQQLWFLFKKIVETDIIYCEFAGYHTFLPVIFGKLFRIPVIILLGGTECHSFPSIRYGNFNKVLQGWFTKFSLRNATHLMPVHESLVECDYRYSDKDYKKQGYKFFARDVKTPHTTAVNGYDSQKFVYKNLTRIKNSFITVAGNKEASAFYRKGIDLIVDIAPFFPTCTFTVIGCTDQLKAMQLPPNIELLYNVSNEELVDHYSTHEFYLQLSMAEGFPNALCEAMLCEAIPIGSDVFGIPDIIGDAGFILKKKSLNKLEELLHKAMECDKKHYSKAARARIVENFPLRRREKELITLFKSLLK